MSRLPPPVLPSPDLALDAAGRSGRVSGGSGGFGYPAARVDLGFLFDPAARAAAGPTPAGSAAGRAVDAAPPAAAPASAVRTVSLSDGTTIAFTVAGAA